VRHRCDPYLRPTVTVQLPLYNEMNVAERVVRAAAGLEYDVDRLVVQILDDSSDGTAAIVDAVLAGGSLPRGIRVHHVRRATREGYKAGALAAGMRLSPTDLYAVFDADFLPPADFLERTVGHFADPTVGMVQTRWGHLNRRESLLTRAQALAIDAHFAVEQQARFGSGLLLNFNGSAGLWRGAAIVDAGGWSGDTLTEDLDLSYRAQLRGWKAVYAADVEVPAEIPADINAFKNQQFRWAKGSLQTARKLLPAVYASSLPRRVKAQAFIHLLGYLVHPLLVGLLLTTAIVLRHLPTPGAALAIILLAAAGPPLLVIVSQRDLHCDWLRRALGVPALIALGIGVALVGTRAFFEVILGVRSGFVRTPKRGEGRRAADYRSHSRLHGHGRAARRKADGSAVPASLSGRIRLGGSHVGSKRPLKDEALATRTHRPER
jgi:cellulose synthase/poly-beta-1,6-N-acetylglucosamine synthase-like glycosyltransferase